MDWKGVFLYRTEALAQGCKVRANQLLIRGDNVFCLTFHYSRGTSGPWTRGTSRTLGGRRALDLRAPSTRARRALSLRLLALRAIENDWILLGNRALQDIIAEVRDGRALALQNVVAQVRASRARRNGAL